MENSEQTPSSQPNPQVSQSSKSISVKKRSYTALYILLGIIGFSIVVSPFVIFLHARKTLEDYYKTAGNDTLQKQITSTASSSGQLDTAIWKTYTNSNLGFSMKVPEQMILSYGSCEWNSSENSYRPKTDFVPAQVFEDGNSVYISSQYYYQLGGEKKVTEGIYNTYYFSSCNKVENSLALLKEGSNAYEREWRITVKEVSNDEELNNFIQNQFGQIGKGSVILGKKQPSNQDGVYDLVLQNNGIPMIGYGVVIKYYPFKKKVVYWGTGQSCTFSASIEDVSKCLDSEIIQTFKFTDQTEDISLDTANWKTYTNTNLGFSFSYPQELNYLYDQFDNFLTKNAPGGNLLLQNFDGSKPFQGDQSSIFQLAIDVYRNSESLTLDTYVNNQRKANNVTEPSQNVTISGKNAIKGMTVQKNERVHALWFMQKGYIFTVYLETPKSTFVNWFNQILSTFKFTQ